MTLIRSTLSSIPTYFMSLHIIQASVAGKLEAMQRDFLWEGEGGTKRYHLVAWDSVCQAKSNGGLGVRRLGPFNKALLGKWMWRFAVERDRFWRKVIEAKYGSVWGGWRTAR